MLNNAGKLYATSYEYESYDALNHIHPNFYSTVNELSSFKNVKILYIADATDVQGSASSRSLWRTGWSKLTLDTKPIFGI